MTLTLGTGPLSTRTDGTLLQHDYGGGTFVQPYPRRLRALAGGHTIVDTERARMLHGPDGPPAVWVPREDIDLNLVSTSQLVSPPQGDDPVSDALRGFVLLPMDQAERWFIEDEPVYSHIKDPYHRVDVVASSRHVLVRYGNGILAETRRPKLLYETGLPVRYYLPWADVRLDRLTLSDTVSECPYKGDGQHWHLEASSGRVENVAWSLPHPLPEGAAAREHVCFYVNRVEVIVGGQLIEA